MTKPHDNRPLLAPDDARFVERLSNHYAPEPPTPALRAAFDEALRRRIERPRLRAQWLAPAFAAALTIALWAWVGAPGIDSKDPIVTAGLRPEPRTWEEQLLYPPELSGANADETETLPNDYLAIESLFLGS